jgi:hypothetical protein
VIDSYYGTDLQAVTSFLLRITNRVDEVFAVEHTDDGRREIEYSRNLMADGQSAVAGSEDVKQLLSRMKLPGEFGKFEARLQLNKIQTPEYGAVGFSTGVSYEKNPVTKDFTFEEVTKYYLEDGSLLIRNVSITNSSSRTYVHQSEIKYILQQGEGNFVDASPTYTLDGEEIPILEINHIGGKVENTGSSELKDRFNDVDEYFNMHFGEKA